MLVNRIKKCKNLPKFQKTLDNVFFCLHLSLVIKKKRSDMGEKSNKAKGDAFEMLTNKVLEKHFKIKFNRHTAKKHKTRV